MPHRIEPDAVYKVADVALLWGTSDDSVYYAITHGGLRSFTVGKSGKRIFGAALLAYMAGDERVAS